MGNPAFELLEIFDQWKSSDAANVSMLMQRKANDAAGLETIRDSFRLVATLEVEVERLAQLGIDPTEYRSTLNFCTRAVLGVPGAWQSRPEINKQFPEDKIRLLKALGHLISARSGITLGGDPDRILNLLDEIETALENAPVDVNLDRYIRKLVEAIRAALSAPDAFNSAAIADDLLKLVVATKAAEASVDDPATSSWWSKFWEQFFPATASAALVEVGASLMMLPLT